jgi:hypothetical protein
MWTVVYIATSLAMAERLRAVLEGEGLLAHLRPLDLDENGRGSVEVLVPEGEAEEAQEVLTQHLGGLK